MSMFRLTPSYGFIEVESPSTLAFRMSYIPMPNGPAKRKRIKLYAQRRSDFIRRQMNKAKALKKQIGEGGIVIIDDHFLGQHNVIWRRPYVAAIDTKMIDALDKRSFVSAFNRRPPTLRKLYPVRRSPHTLPNTKVEEHCTQPILWRGLEKYDDEFSGQNNPPVDRATYLAEFLASQKSVKADDMPRYGRKPE